LPCDRDISLVAGRLTDRHINDIFPNASRGFAAVPVRRTPPSIHKENPMDIDTHNDLETKAGIPLDAVVTHGEMIHTRAEPEWCRASKPL
jgi:hypothetical protein